MENVELLNSKGASLCQLEMDDGKRQDDTAKMTEFYCSSLELSCIRKYFYMEFDSNENIQGRVFFLEM